MAETTTTTTTTTKPEEMDETSERLIKTENFIPVPQAADINREGI